MREKSDSERTFDTIVRATCCLIGSVLLLLAAYQLADIWGAILALGAMFFLFGLLALRS
jgi:hypothetical protein